MREHTWYFVCSHNCTLFFPSLPLFRLLPFLSSTLSIKHKPPHRLHCSLSAVLVMLYICALVPTSRFRRTSQTKPTHEVSGKAARQQPWRPQFPLGGGEGGSWGRWTGLRLLGGCVFYERAKEGWAMKAREAGKEPRLPSKRGDLCIKLGWQGET